MASICFIMIIVLFFSPSVFFLVMSTATAKMFPSKNTGAKRDREAPASSNVLQVTNNTSNGLDRPKERKGGRVESENSSQAPKSLRGAGTPEWREKVLSYIKTVLENWRLLQMRTREFADLIQEIALTAREEIMKQPSLVDVTAPIHICGDLHGQVHDLVSIFQLGGLPPETKYLFLGDYVDRGKHGIEVITTLLGLKCLYPDHVTILRGNHESDSVCRQYGFFDECKRRLDVRAYKYFMDVFTALPIAAIIEKAALCMHGGLSPELSSLDQIRRISRPTEVPDRGLLCDLLWSDPSETSGWSESDRGVSANFGADVVHTLCDKLEVDLIVRAHQCQEQGYQFFANRRLVTVFSASNYCGEFDNKGAMLTMDENLVCRFHILKCVPAINKL